MVEDEDDKQFQELQEMQLLSTVTFIVRLMVE